MFPGNSYSCFSMAFLYYFRTLSMIASSTPHSTRTAVKLKTLSSLSGHCALEKDWLSHKQNGTCSTLLTNLTFKQETDKPVNQTYITTGTKSYHQPMMWISYTEKSRMFEVWSSCIKAF